MKTPKELFEHCVESLKAAGRELLFDEDWGLYGGSSAKAMLEPGDQKMAEKLDGTRAIITGTKHGNVTVYELKPPPEHQYQVMLEGRIACQDHVDICEPLTSEYLAFLIGGQVDDAVTSVMPLKNIGHHIDEFEAKDRSSFKFPVYQK